MTTYHIDIRHHFIRELVECSIVTLKQCLLNNQLAGLFTKPLDIRDLKLFKDPLAWFVLIIVYVWLLSDLMSKTLFEYQCLGELLTWEVNDLKQITCIVSRSCTWAWKILFLKSAQMLLLYVLVLSICVWICVDSGCI